MIRWYQISHAINSHQFRAHNFEAITVAVGGAKLVLTSYWSAAAVSELSIQHPSSTPTPHPTPTHIKVTGILNYTTCFNRSFVRQPKKHVPYWNSDCDSAINIR